MLSEFTDLQDQQYGRRTRTERTISEEVNVRLLREEGQSICVLLIFGAVTID